MKVTIESTVKGIGVSCDNEKENEEGIAFALAMGFLSFCLLNNFSKTEIFEYLEECYKKANFEMTLSADNISTLEMLKRDYEAYLSNQESS